MTHNTFLLNYAFTVSSPVFTLRAQGFILILYTRAQPLPTASSSCLPNQPLHPFLVKNDDNPQFPILSILSTFTILSFPSSFLSFIYIYSPLLALFSSVVNSRASPSDCG